MKFWAIALLFSFTVPLTAQLSDGRTSASLSALQKFTADQPGQLSIHQDAIVARPL